MTICSVRIAGLPEEDEAAAAAALVVEDDVGGLCRGALLCEDEEEQEDEQEGNRTSADVRTLEEQVGGLVRLSNDATTEPLPILREYGRPRRQVDLRYHAEIGH